MLHLLQTLQPNTLQSHQLHWCAGCVVEVNMLKSDTYMWPLLVGLSKCCNHLIYWAQEIEGYVAPAGVTARPMAAFRNGEVAYDLNGFYLAKRDSIKNNTGNQYYYTIQDPVNNILSELPAGYEKPKD